MALCMYHCVYLNIYLRVIYFCFIIISHFSWLFVLFSERLLAMNRLDNNSKMYFLLSTYSVIYKIPVYMYSLISFLQQPCCCHLWQMRMLRHRVFKQLTQCFMIIKQWSSDPNRGSPAPESMNWIRLYSICFSI